jgi:hypothetical protein
MFINYGKASAAHGLALAIGALTIAPELRAERLGSVTVEEATVRKAKVGALPARTQHLTSQRSQHQQNEPGQQVASPTLANLQQWHNPVLYEGLVRFRSTLSPPGQPIVGDNTDPWGMTWTKCTNLGIDLLATMVAEQRGLVPELQAKEHITRVLTTLSGLPTYNGIFPENIVIKGGVGPEIVGGKTRFSSIDSAWVTLVLSLIEAHYRVTAPALARAAQALLAPQDYRVFVGKDGLLGAGFYVDVATNQKAETIAFSYNDRNSEARPLLLALIGMNQLPASAWDNTVYDWTDRDGLIFAKSWHYSAFVEMTGALFFDEAALAPLTLGRSHQSYIAASRRVAERSGHQIWGYAPACDSLNAYAEFGLDRPDSVSPYAAALLTLTNDPAALSNFNRVLKALPRNGTPLPDGVDPHSGQVSCAVARLLDQGLMFLALNADVVRGLVRKTSWYPAAANRLTTMDQVFHAPAVRVEEAARKPSQPATSPPP